MRDDLPYAALPQMPKTGARHAWGVFGADDELGTLNFITPEAVRNALRSATAGRVVNLNLPLDVPQPSLIPGREAYRHGVAVRRFGRDDWLDRFYLQASSQWDSLRHIRYREFGYYGGREEEDLDTSPVLGIQVMAARGIVARGVLLDVAGYRERRGDPVPATERVGFGPDLLEEVAAAEGVDLVAGDVLLVRTGWLRWYLDRTEAERRALAGALDATFRCPGVESGEATAAWLWDHRIAALAADNPAVEALPVEPERGFLHRWLIPLLGMPLGELWDLEALAGVCREAGRYAFLLVSAPLNLPGGVGSPANAYAIF
ncbi:MAG: cyclase family protein [Actinomycetia bacterium]|nr:cyclase family protein [Actinomycetes bacterium]